MGFGGGGGGGGKVEPVPKAEVTKPVTEAAVAARDAQKDRAKKVKGLSSTILTGDFDSGGKTLLGE